MDWDWRSKKDWSKEDRLYNRKREVNNKGSRVHEHIIGRIYSCKMKRSVPYESLWGECLFYYLLELDPLTVRYYEQPVVVPIKTLTKDHVLKERGHIPDTLSFRVGSRPHLFQIKGGNEKIEQDPLVYKFCMKYALERDWNYSVIHPKITIPNIIKDNISFLVNYLEPRLYYADWMDELIYRIGHFKQVEILRLAKSMEPKVDYRYILPMIYHLIVNGTLTTNLLKKMDRTNEVSFGSIFSEVFHLFNLEGSSNEIMQSSH